MKINKKEKHFGGLALPRFDGNKAIEDYVMSVGNKWVDCIHPIQSILLNEGCRESTLFKMEKALCLDEVEALIAKEERHSPCPSVDMVIGCANHSLLLVEAKYRIKSVENIAGKPLNEKIKYSRQRLRCNEDYSVHRGTIVLLSDVQFEQKKNKLLRLMDNKSFCIVPMLTSHFRSIVFV